MSQYEDFLRRRKAQQQQQQQQERERQVFVVQVEMDAFQVWAMQVGRREQQHLALAA